MNRKLLLLVFLVLSDCSPLPFQIFLRKVFRMKQQILSIPVCRAWPQGFRSLSCQQGHQLLLTLVLSLSVQEME